MEVRAIVAASGACSSPSRGTLGARGPPGRQLMWLTHRQRNEVPETGDAPDPKARTELSSAPFSVSLDVGCGRALDRFPRSLVEVAHPYSSSTSSAASRLSALRISRIDAAVVLTSS